MFTCRSRFLTRAEVWYDEEPGDTRSVDWILYQQRSRPVPGSRSREFFNYVVDLTQSAERLREQLSKDTAYKIRRARERDEVVCERRDPRDPAVLDQFEAMYNPFAAARGLSALDRGHLNSMAAAGVLDLSVARDAQGRVLVWHANHRDHRRATQMHAPSVHWKLSDSAERNRVGRANRWLLWSDMMRYQEAGLTCFDFGGWYRGSTNAVLLKINDFKKGFGGRIVREYVCERILTCKGWVIINTARLLKRARLLRSAPGRPATPPSEAEFQPPAGLVFDNR